MTCTAPSPLRNLVTDGVEMLEPYTSPVGEAFFNPLANTVMTREDPLYVALEALYFQQESLDDLLPSTRGALREHQWITGYRTDWDRRFCLTYASLEASSLCNQSCVFCPVSVAPRPHHQMGLDRYRAIAEQLAVHRDTLRGVFMNNYNEPTADRHFIEQVALLKEHGLAPALNTNASGLTPPRIDRLLELGGLAYLSVNLSTINPDRYQRDRGVDLLHRVLANLDYAGQRPIAEQMIIAVLGHEDEDHVQEHERIAERFAGSRYEVRRFTLMDRAHYLDFGLPSTAPHQRLRGCDQTGSRPVQHLHINPRGQCILCCQDYGERYVVGDLSRQSVAEVMSGDALARERRLIYGYELAPANHICRRCVFTCTDPEPA